VLLKGFDERGFVFFTNYDSKKGRDLANDPRVAMHFFWPELERQIEITGIAERTSREESETYFAFASVDSKLGAWASKQSSDSKAATNSRSGLPMRGRDQRGATFRVLSSWGGFRVVPTLFEFWQGRPNRLHDRIRYAQQKGVWKITRLYP
jgi:pyridoxamine 5'-phosphate oxidase